MKHKDKLKGGKADKMKPSDFDSKKLKDGTDHEMEHTNDRKLAQEIAMDHLAEDENYYDKLKEIEKSDKPSEKKYHIFKDGYRVTAHGEEKTMKELEQAHGIKNLNNTGHVLVPADEVSKYDRVDEEADGKKELDYGKEELEKKPSLKERWAKMKKALDSNEAIMTMESQEYHDEDQDQEEDQDEAQDQQADEEAVSGSEEDAPPAEGETSTMEGESEGTGSEESGDAEQLSQLLREEGYSDAEIAYIVHGHIMPQATVDDIKMDGEKQSNQNDQAVAEHELEHKKRMSDLEYETAAQEQGINELDKEHKKRMLDLEYDAARREKELELEFKKKELEAKLQAQKDKAAHQLKTSKDSSRSRSLDAAKTSEKEKAGK